MLTPAQVAKVTNVTSQSIRNWSREYAAFLSPGANAQARLYTDEDVQILRLVADLRKSGMPRDEVAARLRNGDTAPPVIDASPQIAPNEPQNELNTSLAMQMGFSALQGHVDALARRVDALAMEQSAQRRQVFWWGALWGAVAAFVAAAFVVWLLWLLM